MLRYAAWNAGAAGFLALFGAVYEHFSHGVYSYAMIYAFAVPLLLGTLPLLIAVLCGKRSIRPFALVLWHCGIAALAAGAVVQGVLEIYGTTNRLTAAYPAAGTGMLAAGMICALTNRSAQMSCK